MKNNAVVVAVVTGAPASLASATVASAAASVASVTVASSASVVEAVLASVVVVLLLLECRYRVHLQEI
jgi:hypothetical protein